MVDTQNDRFARFSPAQQELYRALVSGKARVPQQGAALRQSRPDEALVLSMHQHGLLQHHVPGVTYRNQSMHLLLEGTVNSEIMSAALAEIAERHDGLRAEFPLVQGQHSLAIRPSGPVTIQQTDLSDLPPEARTAAVEEYRRAFDSYAFDVERGPLYRFGLTKIAPQIHIFSMLVDHLLFDGWSFGIIVEELNAIYNRLIGASAYELAPAKFQFADYARWERESATDQRVAKARNHWLRLLEAEQPKIAQRGRAELNPDHTEVRIPISAGTLSEPLLKFSRTAGVSGFVTTYAIFRLLALRNGAFRDEPIASSATNRMDPTTHRLIGPISSCLLIADQLSDGLAFDGYVAEVARAVGEAMAYQLICPCALAEEQSLVWQFPYYFTFQNYPVPKIALDGVKATLLDVNYGVTHSEIAIFLGDEDGVIEGQLAYDASKRNAASAAALWDDYLKIAASLLENPRSPEVLGAFWQVRGT